MPQVSRSTFTTNLNTLINDNTVKDVTPAEVRSIFTDLEDSAVWFDEGVLRNATSTVTVGYTATAFDIGTVSSGTTTLSFANGQFQTLTNNGAFTLAAPTGTASMYLQVTNGASAGTVTFSGFNRVEGAMTTTNGAIFLLTIVRIGSRVLLYINDAVNN